MKTNHFLKFSYTVIIMIWSINCFGQKRLHGDNLDISDYKSLPHFNQIKKLAILPEIINFKKYCPNIIYQNAPTCFAYASAYYGRSILYNIAVNEYVNPDKNRFSHGFITLLAKKDGCVTKKCKGGCSAAKAADYMSNIGVVKFERLTQTCPTSSVLNDALISEAGEYKIIAEKLYDECDDAIKKIETVKQALNDSTPVLFGLYVPKSLHRANSSNNPDLYELTERERNKIPCKESYHAMCVVGYDETKYGGVFEIVNSWGDNWKNKGYTYIKYDDFALIARYSIRIRNIEKL